METSKVQGTYAGAIASAGIAWIKSGKIRNHKLGNSSRIHTGEVEKRSIKIIGIFFPEKTVVWCMS